MSMNYKANMFDYDRFQNELGSALYEALETNISEPLIRFIDENIKILKTPLEGKLLDTSWRSLRSSWTVQNYGDFAITKFYDPKSGIMIGPLWLPIDDFLHTKLGDNTPILFGEPFGPESNYFDPGVMGSYFQSAQEVQTNFLLLHDLTHDDPGLLEQYDSLDEIIDLFRVSARAKMGLYVRF